MGKMWKTTLNIVVLKVILRQGSTTLLMHFVNIGKTLLHQEES
jgi:hypothetical protein